MTKSEIKTPFDVIEEHSDRLDAEVTQKAEEILSRTDYWTYGYSPAVMAATAVYSAALLVNKKIPMRKVAESFDVTKPSVEKRHYGLIDALGDENSGGQD